MNQRDLFMSPSKRELALAESNDTLRGERLLLRAQLAEMRTRAETAESNEEMARRRADALAARNVELTAQVARLGATPVQSTPVQSSEAGDLRREKRELETALRSARAELTANKSENRRLTEILREMTQTVERLRNGVPVEPRAPEADRFNLLEM